MKEIAKAIIRTMQAVKNIEKNMTVGAGGNSYKGVADKDVKKAVGDAMSENGLCIIPIEIKPVLQIERWIEKTQYGDKAKAQFFVEVTTKYLLLHESGESIEIAGYGHGVDSMDKAAGKASTYAMKYALLYTFMIPTGTINDADNTHSDAYKAAPPKKQADPKKVLLTIDNPKMVQVVESVKSGKYTVEALRTWYVIDADVEMFINNQL